MKSNLDMVIVDKDGEWFMNIGLFPMPDPDGRVFAPMMPVKIKDSEWRKLQAEIIVPCADPYSGDKMPEQIKPIDNTIVPKDEETGQPDLKSASGVREPAKTQAKAK